jgi:two-component system response regulator TctD
MRVLLVEDNVELVRTLTQALQAQQAVVDSVHDGEHADLLLRKERYDVIVLDLALPGRSGLDVLRRLRARGDTAQVLILTASGQVEDRVRGLDAGADDYLSKPFDLAEFEARLRALNRRARGHAHTVIEVGRLRHDSVARSFHIGDERLALPPREHALLEALIERHGQPVGKRALVEHLCSLEDSLSHDALEIYVHRLRRKLAGSGAAIHTLRGLGYILEPDDASPA